MHCARAHATYSEGSPQILAIYYAPVEYVAHIRSRWNTTGYEICDEIFCLVNCILL